MAQQPIAYRDPRYVALLAAHNSHLHDTPAGPSGPSRQWCAALLQQPQPTPRVSLFSDDAFAHTVQHLQGRNEARIVQDITRLLVPSAEALASRNPAAPHLAWLVENVNEPWDQCVPLARPRPQPDYSVGFRAAAFAPAQQRALRVLAGGRQGASLFDATDKCVLPFLACEVKRGGATLDIADRQNAHSMTLAVRGVVELFRAAGREAELNGEILAFSISHDNTSVRIYGHYAVVRGRETAYYRHLIRSFSFTQAGGQERWTGYRFTRNVYDLWVPRHLARVRGVVDALVARESGGVRRA